VGGIILARKFEHVLGDLPARRRHRDRFTLQSLGEPERVRNAVALGFGKLRRAPGFDVKRRPGRMQAICQALGIAHQAGRARVFADTDENAIARRPRPRDRPRPHVFEQLFVDALGRAP
jgi:hypothetical protein